MRTRPQSGVKKFAPGTVLVAFAALTMLASGAVVAHANSMVWQVSAEQKLIRVSVMLRAPKSLRALDDGTAAGDIAYAKANLALQEEVIRSIFGRTPWQLGAEGRSIEQFKFIPAFSLNATEEEIRRLRADQRVKSVNQTTFVRPN